MMKSAYLVWFVVSTLACTASATRIGDEDFGPEVSGAFYVFADKTVHIITPFDLQLTKNLTIDSQGSPLTNAAALNGSSTVSRSWNDAAFVQDAESNLRFVVVNEGDTYVDNNGSTTFGYMSVIDAISQEFVARVKVGARPVHIYSINETNTIWTHSDAEGTFYVIPLDDPQNISVATKVPGFVDYPAHGKLVVNTALYPVAYGTNVAESILPKYDLSKEIRTANIQYNTSLPDPSLCVGTHTIVYSRFNRHLYLECADYTGVLEWNTVNDTFVKLHNISGVVAGSPADDIIFVGDNVGSEATMLAPAGNGQPSTIFGVLEIDYNPYPYYPAFYSNSSNQLEPGAFTDYTIFFPLTRNTNVNNIRAAGANVTSEAYMKMPSDCQYNRPSNVMSASVSSMSSAPGLTLATAANGSSLTPSCGACAPGINSSDASQFNASLSGLGVLDLSVLGGGERNATTTLLPAGATLPRINLASGANQCSFVTEPIRSVKRGGAYIATTADFPQPSIYVIDASSSSDALYGKVNTAPRPSKIVWVPAVVN